MTYAPVNAQSTYLPIEFQVEGSEAFFRQLIAERERLTSSIVNIKENGQYQTQELLTAQTWFSTKPAGQQQFVRNTFRTVVNFGPLPNAGTATAPHNISITSSTIFTRIYGAATNPSTTFVPLPYVNVTTPTDGVELWIDSKNVNIKTTTGTWAPFTTCYVVLEYIKA